MGKMDMGHYLHQEMQMQMQITPQQIMAVNLLQLQQATLEARLKQEIEDNPALELVEKTGDDLEEMETEEESTGGEEEFDEDYYAEYFRYGERRFDDEKPDKQALLEEMKEPPKTLHEHLFEQLWELDLRGEERAVAEMIIINLTPDGFLKLDEDGEPFIFKDPRYPRERIEEVLEKIHRLDPPGIAARNHQESLLLQLDRLEGEFPIVREILAEHYEDLLRNRIPKIAREMGISVEDVKQAIEIIRKNLTPRPAGEFSGEELRYISPDVIVRKTEDGFDVELAGDFCDGIRISPEFKRKLQESVGKAREFYRAKLADANMIIRAIEQRRETLLRISRAIVDRQREWFEGVVDVPRGITRYDIARDIGVHHSTVSRGVMNKYMDTPRGIYPFSYFFGGKLHVDTREAWKTGEEEKSVKEVKRLIREIIDSEDKRKPLSDNKIREIIRERLGVSIARRTVAKYRESMGILGSSKRKEY